MKSMPMTCSLASNVVHFTALPIRGGFTVARRAVFVLLASSLLLSAGGVSVQADPPAKGEPKKGDGFAGRTKEGKARLLKEFGGSEEGEEAVLLGLAWLTQMQKKDGHWQYDAGATHE